MLSGPPAGRAGTKIGVIDMRFCRRGSSECQFGDGNLPGDGRFRWCHDGWQGPLGGWYTARNVSVVVGSWLAARGGYVARGATAMAVKVRDANLVAVPVDPGPTSPR